MPVLHRLRCAVAAAILFPNHAADRMTTATASLGGEVVHPIQVEIEPALTGRDRLTTAFRLVLAIPHLILVGAPVAGALSWAWRDDSTRHANWSVDGGVLG